LNLEKLMARIRKSDLENLFDSSNHLKY